jgi:hypothetical protein
VFTFTLIAVTSNSDFADSGAHGRFPDVRSEAITNSRDCDDVLVFVLTFSEHTPEEEYVLRKIPFFDEAVGPDGSHQFIFAYYPAATAHQSEKNLKGLGRNVHRPPFMEKQASSCIDLIGIKLVKVSC